VIDLEGVRLSELEADALTELVNLGVSRAALNLRELVGNQVLLTAPSVTVLSRSQALELLGQAAKDQLIAVHETFEGDISGRAILLFLETQSLELVRAVIGTELPLEDIVALEHESIAETGNIVLNSCLATIANTLQRSLRISLPEVLRGSASEILYLPASPGATELVLFIYMQFSVGPRVITGYVAMSMDVASMLSLKALLTEFIERMAGNH
jgi:chemotaxis protein CheC